MPKQSLSREQIWKEIDDGKRKISFWKFPSILFPRSNTSLLAGILSVFLPIPISQFGFLMGIIGVVVGIKALKDPHEKKRAYRIKAKIGLVLSILGIISYILIYIAYPALLP